MNTSFGWEGKGRYMVFIPLLADERGVCAVQVKLRSPENAGHTSAP